MTALPPPFDCYSFLTTIRPPLPDAVLPSGFCAFELPVAGLQRPRSVLSISGTAADLLAVERKGSNVIRIEDTDGDSIPDTRSVLVQGGGGYGLNHGLTVDDDNQYLYASSNSAVYRWNYTDGLITNVTDESPTVVVDRIPSGGHWSRTLILDDQKRLYVSIGSRGNIDSDSSRSRIRRFDISDSTTFPIRFDNGEVFADGVRNEVGLAFDRHGVLWGVENGADRLQREDLGANIYNDNPAEELHQFKDEDSGSHYGYPYCWTEYLLPEETGLGRGTVWAWPSFMANITDEYCRETFARAELAMQAHSAPLGITFYNWIPNEERPLGCTAFGVLASAGGAFPASMDGFAFIAYHGSWNRDVPTGYKVVYVAMDEEGNVASDAEPVDLLAHVPPNARWENNFRPVDLTFDDCGRLLVSSDGGSGSIVRIEYHGEQT